jgi:hypothetical protein
LRTYERAQRIFRATYGLVSRVGWLGGKTAIVVPASPGCPFRPTTMFNCIPEY